MGKKQVTWQRGAFVFFRAIMDPELALALQPWFESQTVSGDEVPFWWKWLRIDPKSPLMTAFVGGETFKVRLNQPHLPNVLKPRLSCNVFDSGHWCSQNNLTSSSWLCHWV